LVEVKFYDGIDDSLLKFADIITKTGAVDFSIKLICVYSVKGGTQNGQ